MPVWEATTYGFQPPNVLGLSWFISASFPLANQHQPMQEKETASVLSTRHLWIRIRFIESWLLKPNNNIVPIEIYGVFMCVRILWAMIAMIDSWMRLTTPSSPVIFLRVTHHCSLAWLKFVGRSQAISWPLALEGARLWVFEEVAGPWVKAWTSYT